jgi:hypothetical protein
MKKPLKLFKDRVHFVCFGTVGVARRGDGADIVDHFFSRLRGCGSGYTKETIVVTITVHREISEFFSSIHFQRIPADSLQAVDNNLVLILQPILYGHNSHMDAIRAWPMHCGTSVINQWANGSRPITVTGNALLRSKTEEPEGCRNPGGCFRRVGCKWRHRGQRSWEKPGLTISRHTETLLVKAIHLMERGQARKAYMKLMMAQKMSRFLLKGYAVWDLRHEINLVLADLKQAGTWPVQVAQEEWPETGILLEAFDEWVQSGDIKGKGAGKNAAKQVAARIQKYLGEFMERIPQETTLFTASTASASNAYLSEFWGSRSG